jgi:DNA modification methylase
MTNFGKCLETGIGAKYGREELTGTSIFDPVLCELAYSWFSPKGGIVLDPFAGGSVRGIVASKLGRQYIGVDLRAEQVAANRKQGDELCDNDATPPPGSKVTVAI